MTLLSRKVDYALMILCHLHHRPEGGCAREIAERFGLKKAFAANVLKLLCRRGLVRSQRGTKGGYVLGRPAEQIVLDDLLGQLDEPFNLADCNRTDGRCGMEAVCPARAAVAAVNARIHAVLREVTLADLARQPAAGPCAHAVQEVGLIERAGTLA